MEENTIPAPTEEVVPETPIEAVPEVAPEAPVEAVRPVAEGEVILGTSQDGGVVTEPTPVIQ